MPDVFPTPAPNSGAASETYDPQVNPTAPPVVQVAPVPVAVTQPITPPGTPGHDTVVQSPANASQMTVGPDPTLPPAGPVTSSLGTRVTQVMSPEHGMAVLKEKIGLLHTIVNNAGNYATLGFHDLEALGADIAYVLTYIRSKV